MKALWLCSAALVTYPALACKCEMRLGVCSEVAHSVVFTGTVESIVPNFTSRWNLAQQQALNRINQAHERYLKERSLVNLAAVKEAVREAFPDLPEENRRRLDAAATQQSLAALFSSVLEHGQIVHFRVRTAFRSSDDEDDKDGDDAKPTAFDVWTPLGDCGIDFQVGETYLVYASDDEETHILETDSCMRTRRLSDAGADLVYLHFFHDRANPSGRIEGFTTFDPRYQVRQSVVHDPDRIESPAPGLMVELKSNRGSRYASSDSEGRFVFDGLEAGDYQVSAHPVDFPASTRVLAGPKGVHLDARGCSSQTLWIAHETRRGGGY